MKPCHTFRKIGKIVTLFMTSGDFIVNLNENELPKYFFFWRGSSLTFHPFFSTLQKSRACRGRWTAPPLARQVRCRAPARLGLRPYRRHSALAKQPEVTANFRWDSRSGQTADSRGHSAALGWCEIEPSGSDRPPPSVYGLADRLSAAHGIQSRLYGRPGDLICLPNRPDWFYQLGSTSRQHLAPRVQRYVTRCVKISSLQHTPQQLGKLPRAAVSQNWKRID